MSCMVIFLLSLVCLLSSECNLTGVIPSAISNCTLLRNLSLPFNQLIGSIPSELGLLSHLEFLYLDVNQLTGTIPPSLGNLSSLVQLELEENELTGTIPPSLGSLASLVVLRLDGNNLTGVIPDSISNCTLLQDLELDRNQLTGHIPFELGKLLHLRRLFLWDNHLVSGSSSLSFLTALDNELLKDVNESNEPMVIMCLTQFMQIGLVCTRELPQHRPSMIEVVERLEKITSSFLGTPKRFHLPVNILPLLESTSGVNKSKTSSENWSSSTS